MDNQLKDHPMQLIDVAEHTVVGVGTIVVEVAAEEEEVGIRHAREVVIVINRKVAL